MMMQDFLAHHPELATTSAGNDLRNYPDMMGWWGKSTMMGSWQGFFWVGQILAFITWILIIVVLVSFIRWLWKKGDKE